MFPTEKLTAKKAIQNQKSKLPTYSTYVKKVSLHFQQRNTKIRNVLFSQMGKNMYEYCAVLLGKHIFSYIPHPQKAHK